MSAKFTPVDHPPLFRIPADSVISLIEDYQDSDRACPGPGCRKNKYQAEYHSYPLFLNLHRNEVLVNKNIQFITPSNCIFKRNTGLFRS